MSSRIPVGVLLPEGVLVDLPVRPTVERKCITDERLGLLPHFVGCLGNELVFWMVVGLWFVCFADDDPLGKRNIAGTRSCDDSISALLYGVTQFLAEAVIPRPPERRLVRERLEAESTAERWMRSQVVVKDGFIPT